MMYFHLLRSKQGHPIRASEANSLDETEVVPLPAPWTLPNRTLDPSHPDPVSSLPRASPIQSLDPPYKDPKPSLRPRAPHPNSGPSSARPCILPTKTLDSPHMDPPHPDPSPSPTQMLNPPHPNPGPSPPRPLTLTPRTLDPPHPDPLPSPSQTLDPPHPDPGSTGARLPPHSTDFQFHLKRFHAETAILAALSLQSAINWGFLNTSAFSNRSGDARA